MTRILRRYRRALRRRLDGDVAAAYA